MPLWEIFCSPAAFVESCSKRALVRDITAFYVAAGLPAFYVSVLFHPMRGEDIWVGGLAGGVSDESGGGGDGGSSSGRSSSGSNDSGGRGTPSANHHALSSPPSPPNDADDRQLPQQLLARPYVRFTIQHIAIHRGPDEKAMINMCDRLGNMLRPHMDGYDWEFNIQETPRLLWRVNGLVPPEHGTEAERKWIRDGKPSYIGSEG